MVVKIIFWVVSTVIGNFQVLTIDLVTEMPPSIALIFEPAERDMMESKPRPATSRLVSGSMIFYAYIIAGNIIAIGCVLAYLTVYW